MRLYNGVSERAMILKEFRRICQEEIDPMAGVNTGYWIYSISSPHDITEPKKRISEMDFIDVFIAQEVRAHGFYEKNMTTIFLRIDPKGNGYEYVARYAANYILATKVI